MRSRGGPCATPARVPGASASPPRRPGHPSLQARRAPREPETGPPLPRHRSALDQLAPAELVVHRVDAARIDHAVTIGRTRPEAASGSRSPARHGSRPASRISIVAALTPAPGSRPSKPMPGNVVRDDEAPVRRQGADRRGQAGSAAHQVDDDIRPATRVRRQRDRVEVGGIDARASAAPLRKSELPWHGLEPGDLGAGDPRPTWRMWMRTLLLGPAVTATRSPEWARPARRRRAQAWRSRPGSRAVAGAESCREAGQRSRAVALWTRCSRCCGGRH